MTSSFAEHTPCQYADNSSRRHSSTRPHPLPRVPLLNLHPRADPSSLTLRYPHTLTPCPSQRRPGTNTPARRAPIPITRPIPTPVFVPARTHRPSPSSCQPAKPRRSADGHPHPVLPSAARQPSTSCQQHTYPQNINCHRMSSFHWAPTGQGRGKGRPGTDALGINGAHTRCLASGKR